MPTYTGSIGTGKTNSSQTLCNIIVETSAGCLQEQRLRFEGGTAGTQAADGHRQNGNGVAYGRSNGSGAHARRADSNGRSNGHSSANGTAMAGGMAHAAAELVAVPGGSVTLGINVAPENHFVWDNEGPRQPPEEVAGLKASGRPVSNGEFYRFVVGARGYQQPELWAPADLQLLKRDGRSCPATWTVHVRRLAPVCCDTVWPKKKDMTPAGPASAACARPRLYTPAAAVWLAPAGFRGNAASAWPAMLMLPCWADAG